MECPKREQGLVELAEGDGECRSWHLGFCIVECLEHLEGQGGSEAPGP